MANGHVTPDFDLDRIWVERDHSGRALMLRHGAYPFPLEAADGIEPPAESDTFIRLCQLANAYLRHVWRILDAPIIWLEDVLSSAGDTELLGLAESNAMTGLPYLRWLPFGTPHRPGQPYEPRGSSWVTRKDGSTIIDRTAVLIAALSIYKKGEWIALHGHQGVRVVVHVGARVRITGLTRTLPDSELKLVNHPSGRPAKNWALARQKALEAEYSQKPAQALAVGEPGWRVIFPGDPLPDPRTETFDVGLGKRIRKRLVLARTSPLQRITHAHVPAKVFTQDLMARYGADRFRDTRPGRSWEDAGWVAQPLPPVRDTVQLDLKSAGPQTYELQNAGANARVRVCLSPFSIDDHAALSGGATEDDPKQLTASELSGSKNRTDATTAATAYFHANDLFVRLERWKLDLAEAFRFVQLPLLVRYRYGMLRGGGRDGRVVNAMVHLDTDQTPWRIETRFGLADLGSSTRRSPLGLACDPRWNWHEFGHVLLAGSVGELELRFGHSAGDALAAILLDPKSKLADHEDWRYVTFPWVSQPRRRHDREVEKGWGWTGALYQREHFFGADNYRAKAGYWAEQILSTTLFRLYRALGGDTEQPPGLADEAARQAAAEYTAYLVARAIEVMGDAASVPALTPDQFVSALIDADIGTDKFDDGVFNTGRRARIGGAAHKVIRWAFQQQGLYAKSTNGLPITRPGDFEPVDLQIDDLRNKLARHAQGTYAPIKRSAEWRANPAAMWVRRAADGQSADQPPKAGIDNFVYFSVKNLGADPATGVKLHVWAAELASRGLDDPNLKWKLVGSTSSANIAGRGAALFGPVTWDLKSAASGNKVALLAAATCAGDLANVDKSTGLPCSFPHPLSHTGPFKIRCPIEQLVTYDNNLGLRDWKLV